MTNREKYINNASDEELITRLGCDSCIYEDNDCRNNGPGQTCDSGKLNWLSQAAEEEYVHIGEVKITVNAWNEMIDKVEELSSRLDRLEDADKEEVKQMNKTADEMFADLGYVTINKHSPFIYTLNRSNVEIIIGDDGYSKHIFDFENNRISQTITEAEDKAIHKKIEELKCI